MSSVQAKRASERESEPLRNRGNRADAGRKITRKFNLALCDGRVDAIRRCTLPLAGRVERSTQPQPHPQPQASPFAPRILFHALHEPITDNAMSSALHSRFGSAFFSNPRCNALFGDLSEITTSDDAPSTFPQIDAHREKSATPVDSTSNNNVAIDLLLADALTDADSVATATATRETSPEGSTAPETSSHVAAPEVIAPIQPSTSRKLAATPSRTISHIILDSGSSTPIAESSPVADASPSVALRRNPSSRGASMQASQSITNAYADPLGLKKHRESLLQESARARRSPSAGSAGGSGAASATAAATSAAASAKKIATARTFVPPPLVEPPPGMMYTLEGRLRTIPGIAGALVPPGPNSTTTDTNLTPRLEDKGSSNNDFCETCGGHGRFVCCDGCPRSFHFFCMSPPLDIDEMPPSNAAQVLGPPKPNLGQKGKAKAVGGDGGASAELNMEEMWFCNVCVAERQPKAAPKPKGLGPFGFLLPVLSQQNPKSFQLPADVRTYFKDVATANDGDYVNAGMIRQVKPNKHGIIEARDPYRLKDKNGDAVLCFRCGGTALPSSSTSQGQEAAATPADPTIRDGTGWRKIISCDFCPLHWHIDCVDPPMLGMPSNLRKWMCPAHSDHVNDRRRVARIGTSVPRTIDLPIPSAKTIGPGKHFRTRVLNNGDIDIIPDPMEELMGANGISGSLQSGIKDISVIPGVVDEPSLTEGGSKMASRIRYRFPEKVIRTDFWSKLRADEATSIGSVFYVAAEEVVGRTPVRFVAREEDASLDDGRYRPFGKREYARSGLDSLADIAAARLVGDGLAKAEKNPDFIRPSRTRQLIATALGIDLQNDQVPESSIRSSLDEPQASSSAASGSSLESPLSSLSESETEPEATKGDSVAPAVAVPEPAPPALSEEELVKRIAAEAASTVNSGEPLRLTKRKAAVAAESALAGTPTPVAKKMRPASPATTTVSVEVKPAAPAAGAGGKKITIKSNGVVVRSKQKEAAEGLTESQSALRKAYFLAEQHEAERKEVEQLRAIKELMRIKGPGRLLEFLLSPNEDEPSQ